tara:strand:- start:937 stop:1113 length:177 start_codon:yes stop_codon:yes gene_type:complete
MNELLITFMVMGFAFIGLSIGLILRNQPIKGSCGGMANIEEGSTCNICGRTNSESCSD